VNFTSCRPAKCGPRVNLAKLMTKSLPAEPAAGHYSELPHIGSEAPELPQALTAIKEVARNPAVG
jgi:hypothetical protein